MKPNLTYEEYKILVEQAPILIWRSDLSKACDYFNDIWLNFTGRTIEQEMGDGWAEGVHPDDLKRCVDIYVTSFNNRVIFEMEYRLRRYDGKYRWIFDRGVPFTDEDGEFKGYIGSCIDVHERKLAELAHAENLEKMAKLVPICAWCHNIRKDDGYWQTISDYVLSESGQNLTHGICPSCELKNSTESTPPTKGT